MTDQDYLGWDKIEYIHLLQREKEWVNMILSIQEYGYIVFFSNYRVFLAETYPKSRQWQEMFWEEAFMFYTDEFYSQLWRGLEFEPFGYLDERKTRKNKKYEWFDSMYLKEATPTKAFNISDILK